MSLAALLLRKGLRLRPTHPGKASRSPARGVYTLPPEDPMSPAQTIFGVSVITASFFLPVMWYYWDMKRSGRLKTRREV